MDTLLSKVCGLDVHASTVVACVLIGVGTRPKKTIRTFRAMYDDLVELREWLSSFGVEQVVMEGTGIYWRPVYEVLEDSFDLWLVNARHVKNVPGRKSDVIDAEWLARLLRNGLMRKSFVPPRAIRDIRDMSRYRRMLVQTQTTEKNRILKLIEMVGLKLSLVASDVFGVSGLAMLRAIASGAHDVDEVADLARGRLRSKLPELRLALRCTIRDHHRQMLTDQLEQFDHTAAKIAEYDRRLEELVAPYDETIQLLCSIHGIKRKAATEIFAEIGCDLGSFPRAANFSAWAGTSPGLNERARARTRAVDVAEAIDTSPASSSNALSQRPESKTRTCGTSTIA